MGGESLRSGIAGGDFYEIERKFSIIGTDSLRLECYCEREFAEAKTIAHMENKWMMCEALAVQETHCLRLSLREI